MNSAEIKDTLFREAVEAIDAGDIDALQNLVVTYPSLVTERLVTNEPGYFQDPYLLWFVADNPIRIAKLPSNIVDIARVLINAVKREAPETAPEQLTYTLGLVATGRIPRECGVQIELMDLLIDAGAQPGGGLGALAHGNVEAASHLIKRGGKLTLPVAICLKRLGDIDRLLPLANPNERLTALTAAAFYGMADMIALLLANGANPNGYPENGEGFHAHATPLHQAVCSGSLNSVKLLVDAGASLAATDKIFDGTPLGWATYMQTEEGHDEEAKRKFALIEEYLREKEV